MVINLKNCLLLVQTVCKKDQNSYTTISVKIVENKLVCRSLFWRMIFRYRSINNSIIQISANTTCKNGQPDEVVEWRIFCYFPFWFFQNLTKDILSFPPVVAARNPKFYSPVWMGRKIVAMSPGNERKKQRKCFPCFKFSLRICLKIRNDLFQICSVLFSRSAGTGQEVKVD